jgi:hypothetical protein
LATHSKPHGDDAAMHMSPDALDIAVARAEIAGGVTDVRLSDAGRPTFLNVEGRWEAYRPSTSWTHAGPVIEQHWDAIAGQLSEWLGDRWPEAEAFRRGPQLHWFMQAFVASRH